MNNTQNLHKSDLYEQGISESYAYKTSGLKCVFINSLQSFSSYKCNVISGCVSTNLS